MLTLLFSLLFLVLFMNMAMWQCNTQTKDTKHFTTRDAEGITRQGTYVCASMLLATVCFDGGVQGRQCANEQASCKEGAPRLHQEKFLQASQKGKRTFFIRILELDFTFLYELLQPSLTPCKTPYHPTYSSKHHECQSLNMCSRRM